MAIMMMATAIMTMAMAATLTARSIIIMTATIAAVSTISAMVADGIRITGIRAMASTFLTGAVGATTCTTTTVAIGPGVATNGIASIIATVTAMTDAAAMKTGVTIMARPMAILAGPNSMAAASKTGARAKAIVIPMRSAMVNPISGSVTVGAKAVAVRVAANDVAIGSKMDKALSSRFRL